MSEHVDVILSVAGALIALLLAVIGFFLHRLIAKIDVSNDELSALHTKVTVLEVGVDGIQNSSATFQTMREDWIRLQADLTTISKDIREARDDIKAIPVLARDLKTAFGRIDENRAEILFLRERDHAIANKLQIILYHLQKLGCNVDTTFELPKFSKNGF